VARARRTRRAAHARHRAAIRRPHTHRRQRARADQAGEGSTVKLGEKAKFQIERVEDRGIFKATLNVLTGAFRFTTDALKKARQRDVSIKAKNVTAGVRGTDLWGKSDDDRDSCASSRARSPSAPKGHPTVTLDNPLDFYQKPRDGKPQVAKVDSGRSTQWAARDGDRQGRRRGAGRRRWRVIRGIFKQRERRLPLSASFALGLSGRDRGRQAEFWVQVRGSRGSRGSRPHGEPAPARGVAMPLVRKCRARELARPRRSLPVPRSRGTCARAIRAPPGPAFFSIPMEPGAGKIGKLLPRDRMTDFLSRLNPEQLKAVTCPASPR
jgi:hypothetical protein